MAKLLLLSESRELKSMVESSLKETLTHSLITAHTREDVESMMSLNKISLFYYDLDSFNRSAYDWLENLRRDSRYRRPMLLMPNEIKGFKEYEIFKNLRAHFLKKPFNEEQLTGLTKKLLSYPQLPAQIHPRYPTKELAKLEGLFSDDKFTTHMFNLSKGGAYCEFDESKELQIGDLYRFRILLDELSKTYTMNAKVVWVTPKGHCSGRPGVGFEFLQSDDIYRHMNQKI